jgi:hypothetical protein
LAVDSSHIFWVETDGTEAIMEANLDGSGVTTLAAAGALPTGVAVDSSHIYWTDLSGTVMEANLDGSSVTTLASGQPGPEGVAVGPH